MTIELVVARYQEDLRWLRRVPRSVRVTVYDKGGDAPQAVPLPNVGREAHTYLHHIVSRYDDLADATVFVQGKPFDHVPDLHAVVRRLASGDDTVETFRWLGFLVDWDDVDGTRLFQTWSKNPGRRPLPGRDFIRSIWGDVEVERLVFYGGAHFIASAALIRRNPRSFYERCLEVSMSLEDAAHCFERSWDRVFGVDGVPPDIRSGTLPRYLKPIRRLLEHGASA